MLTFGAMPKCVNRVDLENEKVLEKIVFEIFAKTDFDTGKSDPSEACYRDLIPSNYVQCLDFLFTAESVAKSLCVPQRSRCLLGSKDEQ